MCWPSILGCPLVAERCGPYSDDGWTTPRCCFEKEKRREGKIKDCGGTMFYSLSLPATLTVRLPSAREMSDLRFVYSIVPPKLDWSQT